jgi:hypothetical protein
MGVDVPVEMSVKGGSRWLRTLGTETHIVLPQLWGRRWRRGGLEGGLIQREQGRRRLGHNFE